MPQKKRSARDNHRFRPVSRGIKPGSESEYYWEHPELDKQVLREHGIDPDEIERIILAGGGQLPVGDLGIPANQRKQKEARSRSVRAAA